MTSRKTMLGDQARTRPAPAFQVPQIGLKEEGIGLLQVMPYKNNATVPKPTSARTPEAPGIATKEERSVLCT